LKHHHNNNFLLVIMLSQYFILFYLVNLLTTAEKRVSLMPYSRSHKGCPNKRVQCDRCYKSVSIIIMYQL